MSTYLARIALIVVAALLGSGVATNAQETSKLFESGQYRAAVEQTSNDAPPDAQYVKGLAHLKLNQTDEAKAAFRRLEGAGDAWRSVGQSAVALIDGNRDAALEAARAAVARDGGLAPAHYQLGLVLEGRGESLAAADAFARAATANPQMAYAHYNAGMSFYKAKRVDRMAVYFENFLKLAPNAPERPAVESIMRTLRGR
jgi:tetratricopeptide (TPR) repeat protein